MDGVEVTSFEMVVDQSAEAVDRGRQISSRVYRTRKKRSLQIGIAAAGTLIGLLVILTCYFLRASSQYNYDVSLPISKEFEKIRTSDETTLMVSTAEVYITTEEHERFPSSLLDMERCGIQSTDRISNGQQAEVFQFPWMVLLRDIYGHFVCGGSLITDRYVLTAAHCLAYNKVVSVRLGEVNLLKDIDCVDVSEQDCAERPQDVTVAAQIIHAEYKPKRKRNDIALLRLAEAAVMFGDHNVSPICLPVEDWLRKSSALPENMTVSGWGSVSNEMKPSILQYAIVPLVTVSQCNDRYKLLKNYVPLDEDVDVCAGGKNKVDTCTGDSGGPLQYFTSVQDPNDPTNQRIAVVQYAIATFGVDSCGELNIPGSYLKVAPYMDWIRGHLS